MQRRIVFIVNAIFKCLPNLTLLASFLLVQLYNEAAYLFIQSYVRFKMLRVQKDTQRLKLFTGPGCCGSAWEEHNRWESLWVFALVEMLSVKDTQPPPPQSRPISALFFVSGVDCHVCVCVCVRADTGIFTLAKQGSCIDLCDCDEFGIVI